MSECAHGFGELTEGGVVVSDWNASDLRKDVQESVAVGVDEVVAV